MKKYMLSIYFNYDYYTTHYFYVVAYSLKQAKYFLAKHINSYRYCLREFRNLGTNGLSVNDKLGDIEESI